MYQTMYALLRDTGRRPGEIVGLVRDCVKYVDGKPALIYNNYKRRRYRRGLPITCPPRALATKASNTEAFKF